MNRPRLRGEALGAVRRGGAARHGEHPVHGPEQIHRGRTRAAEQHPGFVQVPSPTRRQHQAVGGADSDGRRAAHDHVADAARDVFHRLQAMIDLARRQLALIEHDDHVVARQQLHRRVGRVGDRVRMGDGRHVWHFEALARALQHLLH